LTIPDPPNEKPEWNEEKGERQ